MKKAAIYARYSSDAQTEQSIEGQLRVCQQYAKNNDILVVDTYIDRAMTGTNDMRPDFQRMIRDSAKRQWDYVIVYKLDRFSRDKYATTIHKHTLKENGVKLLSAMENIPDTPEGIILESLLEGMNQYYSAELSQKVKRGLKESYLKGNFTGGTVPYGYDVKDKKVSINPEEGAVIKEIFGLYAQGYTVEYIANELKSRGVRAKNGGYLKEKTIYKMMTNARYNGKTIHGDTVYENIYPKIVDDDTWRKVQELHEENKHSPGRKKEIYDFILSGKLVCGECKHNMVGISGTSQSGVKYYYYTCAHKFRRHPCPSTSVRKTELEDLVIETTAKLLSDDGSLEFLAETICKRINENNKTNTTIKSLEARKAAAVKSSRNLISAIEQGIITEQTKDRLKELESEIARLEFDIEQERQRSFIEITTDKIIRFLKTALRPDYQDITARKVLVKYLIRDIIVYNDRIIINYYFTEPVRPHKRTESSAKETERAALAAAPLSASYCSNKCEISPPPNGTLSGAVLVGREEVIEKY